MYVSFSVSLLVSVNFSFLMSSLLLVSIVKFVTSVAHDYGDNDDNDDNDNMYTILNQVNSNNNTVNLDECNTISPIEDEVNKEYLL